MNRALLLGCLLASGCVPAATPPGDAANDVAIEAIDVAPSDATAPDAPELADDGGGASPSCLTGCAQFNDGASECGVSNYDCAALCAESDRIGEATGCSAEVETFWACFAAAARGAFCRSPGVCTAELDALDDCVALAPSNDCLRACVACGDPSYGTCAIGCARRDAHAALLGCEASYGAYYSCRLSGGCPTCNDESASFSACWSEACADTPERCPITP